MRSFFALFVLKKRGIRIKDVVVFDLIEFSLLFFIMITSIHRYWQELEIE